MFWPRRAGPENVTRRSSCRVSSCGTIASAPAGTDQAAAPAGDEGLGLLAGGSPQVGATASAQLAAAESKRAAKNTANGLLGGILLLLGSMVWAVGMAVFGKKA